MRDLVLGLSLFALGCGGGDGESDARSRVAGSGGSAGEAGGTGSGGSGTVGGASSAGTGSGSSGATGSAGVPAACATNARDGLYRLDIQERSSESSCEDIYAGMTSAPALEIPMDGSVEAGCEIISNSWNEQELPGVPLAGLDDTPACTLETRFRCPASEATVRLWPEQHTEVAVYEYRFRTMTTGDDLYGELDLVALDATGAIYCSGSYRQLRGQSCDDPGTYCEAEAN